MLKVTVKCEDLFTEEEKTVDLYFHLTEAELVSLNLVENKGFTNYKQQTESEIGRQEIVLFEKLIGKAYGKRTADGKFIKNDEIRDEFLCSPEYSALLTKMSAGEITVQDFVTGCFPKSVQSKIKITDDGMIELKEK